VVDKIKVLLSNVKVVDYHKSASTEWCGVSYPDEIAKIVKPKLNMTSLRIGAIVERL